jgi:hypothetical protein
MGVIPLRLEEARTTNRRSGIKHLLLLFTDPVDQDRKQLRTGLHNNFATAVGGIRFLY